MAKRKKVLFVQLPQLDNDLKGDHENVLLAAAYLRYAAESAGEDSHYEFIQLPQDVREYDNAALLDVITVLSPSVVACTLYLWNVERTLRLMQAVRKRLPGAHILLGGPEAAYTHPFLFDRPIADAIVVGEGETIFPALLKALRTGHRINFSTVALKVKNGYRWGKNSPPPVSLSLQLPPPGYASCRPDTRGMAYLETSRGCPMRCTYCRYPHLRRSMSFLEPDEILARVRALRRLGAREIRIVDPSFNSHPRFKEIICRLAALNRTGTLSFFAELNAERLTETEAEELTRARFVEIEVGMQSRSPEVLKAIRRPTTLPRLEAGIRLLTERRIKVTLDIMYGLPLQDEGDVRRSIKWALKLPRTNVQCLQTLLLPGTELRERYREWKLRAGALPPYPVTMTSTMDRAAFRKVESMISRHPKLRSDVPTKIFTGINPELFPESGSKPGLIRRAHLFKGADLYARRQAIGQFIRDVMTQEPDGLFQFVLCPLQEEPLDLLDHLIAVIRRQPRHLLDRYASVALDDKITSRRLLIRLPRGRRLSKDWIKAADQILSDTFF